MSYADGLKIIITIKYNSLELDITGGDDDTKPFGKGDNYGLRQSSYASTTLAYLDYPSVLDWNSQHPGCLSLGFLWLDRELRLDP